MVPDGPNGPAAALATEKGMDGMGNGTVTKDRAASIEDADSLVRAALEGAGAVLLALPMGAGGAPAGIRTMGFDIVREASRGDYPGDPMVRPGAPHADQVSAMEIALAWIADHAGGPGVRRVLWRRALVRPLSGRHLYSFAECGLELKVSKATAQNWHKRGLAQIAAAIPAQLLRDTGKRLRV